MYKIVIADDDAILLKGISTAFDWENLGIQVVASVDDGDKALAAVEETQADIILTDIKMTNMDGLELAEKLKEKYPEVHVVIMSAYDDFEFARRALRLEVNDYLLKPVELEQLSEIMKHIVHKKNQKRSSLQVEKIVSMQGEALAETFFQNLISNRYDREMYQQLEPLYIKGEYCWTVIEIILDSGEKMSVGIDMLSDIMKAYGYPLISVFDRYYVCCFGLKEEISNHVKDLKRECRMAIKQILPDETLSFLNGTIVDEAFYLSLSYEKILQIREYQYSAGKEADLSERDLDRYFNKNKAINKTRIEYLAKLVLLGSGEAIPECMEKIKENLRRAGSHSIIMFSLSLSYLLGALGKDSRLTGWGKEELDKIYSKAIMQKTLDSAIQVLKEDLLELSDKITVYRPYTNEQLVYKACSYIDKHYNNPKLRVTDVAGEVGLSPNYLSTIFTEVMGENFTDYLLKKRMRESQILLLNSNYTSQDIGYMVGYENAAYFSATFKKFVGVSITQYREMVQPEQ